MLAKVGCGNREKQGPRDQGNEGTRRGVSERACYPRSQSRDLGHPDILFEQVWTERFLVGEDGAEADFAFFNFVDGFVGFVHGKTLGGGFDSVAGGDV